MGLSVFDESWPTLDAEEIDAAYGTAFQLCIGGLGRCNRVDKMILSTSSLVDVDVQVWYSVGSTPVTLLGTVTVPAGAGSSGAVAPVDAIAALAVLAGGLVFQDGDSIGVQLLVGLVTPAILWVTTVGGFV